jgi:hypothetical protein
MALTILDDSMSSDRSRHTARRAPCMPSLWEVSWQPGRYLGRSEAITAMVLADTTASGDVHPGDRLWPHIQGWAQELGLTAGDVVTRTACPPRWADKDAFWEFIDDEDRRTDPFMDYVTGHHRYEPGWLPDPPSNANSCGLLQAGRDPQPDSDGPARLQAAPAPDKQAGWEAGQ